MKNKLTIYNDGFVVRLPNRRITLREDDEHIFIVFKKATNDEPEKPAVRHACIRGKVRVSSIGLSVESMEALVYAYEKFKQTMK